MRKTTTFAEIAASRDDAQQKQVSAALAEVAEEETASKAEINEQDKAAKLSLDRDEAPKPKKLSQRELRRRSERAFQQMGVAVDVVLSMGEGELPWAFRVLVRPKKPCAHCPPWIELTAENMRQLHARIGGEIASGETEGATPRAKTLAPRAPRGEKGRREYWCKAKRRYVAHLPVGPGTYRKLTRRPTPILGAAAASSDVQGSTVAVLPLPKSDDGAAGSTVASSAEEPLMDLCL